MLLKITLIPQISSIIFINVMTEVCPKFARQITRNLCAKFSEFWAWLRVVFPSLCCEGNGEISVLSPGMPSSGGHTVSVVAACGRWGEFSHSTPKEVFVSVCQNYHHEIGACWKLRWEKSARKRSPSSRQKGEEKIRQGLCDVYSPFECLLTGGKA